MKYSQNTSELQLPLFLFDKKKNVVSNDDTKFFTISENVTKRLSVYNLDSYIQDVHTIGLSKTWDFICDYLLKYGENKTFLTVENLGELYEIGLDINDKALKKSNGQYYTPDDVADVMGEWLTVCEGENVCDVACGTGKLILAYLKQIGEEKSVKLINSGRLFLYDIDKTALKICKTSIILRYSIADHCCINDVCGDFLDNSVKLPNKAKVIANPPYATIKQLNYTWEHTNVLIDTKELYAGFMEKIITQADSCVIITPFSFISGDKFYSLRKKMSDIGDGFIVAFDNVPGNIFCGKKHGVFNTNTANSVRAAITVFHKNTIEKGFRISPLIRFKNSERQHLLVNDVLESLLPDNRQIIDKNNRTFKKIDKQMIDIFDAWIAKSSYKLKDVITTHETDYIINMPNTCRYFTTAANKKLRRVGLIPMYVRDKKIFNFLYCFINSGFTYWWWRIFDGGITYPKTLLQNMPLPLNLLSTNDELFFEKICKEMIQIEEKYIVTKLNAGTIQENIKFPPKYREQINDRLLKILGCEENHSIFNNIHKNVFL